MTNPSTTEITRLNLTVHLLDDLHSGSGLGNHIIDSLQARDSRGLPIITAQHVKGLFNDAAKHWANTDKGRDSEQKMLKALLDAKQGESERIELVFSSLRFNEDDSSQTPYIVWTSTARGKKNDHNQSVDRLNRVAREDTLRKIEYVRAGTSFEGAITLITPTQTSAGTHDQLLHLVQKVLKQLTHLGGNRNRGAGGITMELIEPPVKVTVPQAFDAKPVNSNSHTLTLQFKNLEPLRLPSTQVPGNVIKTDTTITSGRLRGALANRLRMLGLKTQFAELIDASACDYTIGVSNASPSPDGIPAQSWPLSLQLSKPQVHETQLPWWCYTTNKEVKDTFNCKKEELEGTSFKRNKGPNFIYQKNNEWHAYQQNKSIQMRNAVRTNWENDDSALFSEEVLCENSQFTADISLNSDEQRQQFFAIFDWLKEHQAPFLLGRGKAPCVITEVHAAPQTTVTTINKNGALNLVLASDWLVYDPETLLPREELNLELLNQAFGLQLDSKEVTLKTGWQSRSDIHTLAGFNFATSLPRRPETTLAAGSVIHITDPTLIKKLECAMQTHPVVGEKTNQGLGRYWSYYGELTLTASEEDTTLPPDNMREAHYAEVNKMIEGKKFAGSVSQWQRLASLVTRYEHRQKANASAPPALVTYLNKTYLNNENKTQAITNFLKEDTNTLIKEWVGKLEHQNDFQFSHMLLDSIIAKVEAPKGGPNND